MNYDNLMEIHLDAFKEIFNIGAGHGAKALSMLLGKSIDINIPSLEIINIEDISGRIPLEEVVIGVLVKILGEAPGNILFIFSEKTAKEIIKTLTAIEDEFMKENEVGRSVICEIGNIIAASYMNAVSEFTGIRMLASVPASSYDMTGAILTTAFIDSIEEADKILEVKTDLKVINNNLSTCLYYLPKGDSLEKVLKSIGF